MLLKSYKYRYCFFFLPYTDNNNSKNHTNEQAKPLCFLNLGILNMEKWVCYQNLKCIKVAFGVAVKRGKRKSLHGAVCSLKLFHPNTSSSAETRASDEIKS